MSNVDVNDFCEEKVCVYKNETYSVRDNGAVLRHPKQSNRIRKFDNIWIFGKVGDKGYLYIAGVQVHRIVATAFLGEHLSREYIVDHKDTNKQNNRSENLHWCTREENILNNPNTIEKIEYITGYSIDDVREDWSILHNLKHKQDTSWMRPVTQEEANIFKNRQLEWRQNKKQSSDFIMGEWVFNKTFNIIPSLTERAVQKDWVPTGEFPCCPILEENYNPIENYFNNMAIGGIFYKNQYGKEYKIFDFAKTKDNKTLLIKCEYDHCFRPLILAEVTYENDLYVHSCKRFCTKDGIEKYFTIALGKEWTGGKVFDDYC